MKKDRKLALYSIAHFWVDLSCAFLVFRTLLGVEELAMCLLLYNFCAFALQMPLGLLADRWNRNGFVAAVGCLLVAVAYVTPIPLLTAVVAGIGNSLFHLGGGIDVLNTSQKKAAALGIFVSPGALGLFIGTAWGNGTTPSLWLAPLCLLILATILLRYAGGASNNMPLDPTPARGYAPLLPLFVVVVLRSYMGMNQAFPWKGTGAWAVILTLALVLGKTAGGFLMDKLDARKASAVSLLAAALLYFFCDAPFCGTLAVFLFNMTMPITLWAAARLMPGGKGFAFGLLTFALFLGYLPAWMGWPSLLTTPLANGLAAVISAAVLLPGLRKERGEC